jgi:hypothetical protein
VASLGFDGLWVDRAAYADHAAALERTVAAQTGAQPLVSLNRRLTFFDLRAYRDRLRSRAPAAALAALADVTLHPIASWTGGFSPPASGGVSSWHWMGRTGALQLNSSTAREVVLEVTLRTLAPAHSGLRLPDGTTVDVRTTRSGVRVKRRLRVMPGQSQIEFFTDAPERPIVSVDQSDERMQILNPLVVPIDAVPALEAGAP